MKKRRNRRLLACAMLLVLVGLGSFISSYFFAPEQPTSTEQLTAADIVAPTPTQPAEPQGPPVHTWNISDGDNLSAIFDSLEINQTILYQILAADEPLLALDILRPGNTLTFTMDETGERLEKMALFINLAHQVVYHRVDDDTFEFEDIDIPGTWETQIIEGEINGSFYLSALAAGLSDQETGNITNLFKSRLNFTRDMRAGDHFQVVRSLQLVDGKLTGQSHIEGIRIFARKNSYTAFLFDDGNYYDDKGESLASAFLRYPFKGNYRISSSFNPKRKHPVTGRISPHSGTDFSMPIGTSVLATSDGEVTRVKNHPFAGKYIEIKHDGQYLSRYLHLSKINVKRGQMVKRGQVIAKSGNTGRSTGPHLHYELHIKGRAVNAITAKIPMAASIPKERIADFRQRVDEVIALMEHSHQDLVGL